VDVDAWIPTPDEPTIPMAKGGMLNAPTVATAKETYSIAKRHVISATFPAGCWIGIGPDDPASLHGIVMTPPLSTEIADGEHTVIRSGCPGKMAYLVDGETVHPVNRSKGEHTELVTLP
jgi:hypothetical protein